MSRTCDDAPIIHRFEVHRQLLGVGASWQPTPVGGNRLHAFGDHISDTGPLPSGRPLAERPLHKSKKHKGEILHGACAERSRSIQNVKKRQFVILEEPKATKDLGLCKALLGRGGHWARALSAEITLFLLKKLLQLLLRLVVDFLLKII